MAKNRINNIEIRKCSTGNLWEIVMWYPNDYFGREEDYEWDYDHYKCKVTNKTIDFSFFEYPENCFVISFLRKNKEGDFVLDGVGSRILDLNEQELKDFMTVYKNKAKWKAI
jgi:hypothetical protein